MQSTAPQTKPSGQQASSTVKKTYHSPNLRAAGSVREGTGASVVGTVYDNTVGRSSYTYMSPI